jgi:RNA polymerase sigma-70 factor (ECF subfamily)
MDSDLLAARARDGDREAFEQLVVVTSPGCYQLAYRLVGNEHDARDVVQDTYLRAYRGLKRFRGEASVTTWLHRITVNSAARLVERRSRSETAELDDSLDLADLRPERDPERAASAADDRGRLVEALGELPDALRLVVVLRDVYDLPHREIARELGISQAAAKVRLHRARRLLREQIFPARRSDQAAGMVAGG